MPAAQAPPFVIQVAPGVIWYILVLGNTPGDTRLLLLSIYEYQHAFSGW
jgi:hypothetical protein